MFVLDTNVVSELRKGPRNGDSKVVAWSRNSLPNALFISVITILELEQGVLLKERKDPAQGAVLRSWLTTHVLPSFHGRILPIDTAVAQKCASLHVPNHQSERDALIAATALTHGMTVVTRNVTDFATTGVPLINPWL